MSFISVMDKIGEDIKVVFEDVMKYLPGASELAALIFPKAASTIASVVNVAGIVQTTVALIEQKYSAAQINTTSGAAKLADVLQIVTPIVTQELASAGLPNDNTYITNIVNAVVAILNVQTAVGTTSATAAAGA